MPFFTSPTSFLQASRLYYSNSHNANFNSLPAALDGGGMAPLTAAVPSPHSSHPSVPHLVLLVFEAVLEVVCVSLPGYIVAHMGMFDADAQKFVANLNVMLFTPCLIFTKLASQLTAGKLADLAIIPFIFVTQSVVSYICSKVVARCFRFKKRQSNFVTAMGVFGNSNSLPISLVISLSKTLKGLHWDRVPNDNDEEVAARGILYLLIFQQLGQLLRWSWGYHVLLAPREQYYRDEEERANSRILTGQERYSDTTDGSHDSTLIDSGSDSGETSSSGYEDSEASSSQFASGSQTPIINRHHTDAKAPGHDAHGVNDDFVHREEPHFPHHEMRDEESSSTPKKWVRKCQWKMTLAKRRCARSSTSLFKRVFSAFPRPVQKTVGRIGRLMTRFLRGIWSFMNPPLWAMLAAIIVASIPSLQHLMFAPGTFLSNSVTRAIQQSGSVAVPLILVVLGANLERSTLPDSAHDEHDNPREERNLIIASLVARMLLPVAIMGPILAVTAKYVPVSILDDPIFVIVCFLLTGAPSALQLAQICQINNVYMSAMSKILFHSYVIWILPSTLILVLSALEVVEWAVV